MNCSEAERQINAKADASEAFHLILNGVHEQLKSNTEKGLPCTCPVHPACQLNLSMVTYCKTCHTEGIAEMNDRDQTLFQNIIVREVLDHLNEKVQDAQAKNLQEAQQPDYLLKIASGRFFDIFKGLNQKAQIVRKQCPRGMNGEAASASMCNREGVETYHIVDQPFPFLIIIDLNWSPEDLTSKNCLTVIASLPPFFFIPSIFELRSFYDPQTYMMIYKLKSLIFYTGNHYFTFMRIQSKLSPRKKAWHLFNDKQIEVFPDWHAVV